MGSSRRRRENNVDWVVNDFAYGGGGTIGNQASLALPLTVPQWTLTGESFPTQTFWGGAAFPEQDSGMLVHRVVGHYEILPGTWAAGAFYRCHVRIVKAPYDYASESMNVDANYSLSSATFANERFNWQKVHAEQFTMQGAGETTRVDVKMKQRLEPNEALWIMWENTTGVAQNCIIRSWLRTLVRSN